MANLFVRDIDDEIVAALIQRARQKGISVEAEHRNLLTAALSEPQKRSFAEVIQSIPSAGRDDDFLPNQDKLPNQDSGAGPKAPENVNLMIGQHRLKT